MILILTSLITFVKFMVLFASLIYGCTDLILGSGISPDHVRMVGWMGRIIRAIHPLQMFEICIT